MKTIPTNLIRLIQSLLVVIALLSTAPATELSRPIFSPENVGGIWRWNLQFDTLPGYQYLVEECSDLGQWTTTSGGYFYGNGTPMKCFICNGPPPPPASSGSSGSTAGFQWYARHLDFEIVMQASGISPSYYLKRNHYTPDVTTGEVDTWDALLTESLPLQKVGTRYFAMLDAYDLAAQTLWFVGVTVHILDEPPPPAQLNTPEESADLAVFQKIKPQLIARLLVPNATSSIDNTPHPRKFARVRRVEIDSNGNGLPDWYELIYYGNLAPFAPPGSADYVDGSADDDGDGFSNGEEAAGHTDPNDPNSQPPAPPSWPPPVKGSSFTTKELWQLRGIRFKILFRGKHRPMLPRDPPLPVQVPWRQPSRPPHSLRHPIS